MKVVVMIAAAVTSAALLSPTASQAQVQDEELVSATVSTRGLDLTTPGGRAIYERRLSTQIQRMCSDPGRRDFAAQAAVRQCIANARVK